MEQFSYSVMSYFEVVELVCDIIYVFKNEMCVV
jgi:hypothetical protein